MNIYKFIYETYTILGFDTSPQVTLNLRGLSPIFFPSFPSSLPLSTYSPILVPPLPPIHSQLTILFSFSRDICRYKGHPQALTLWYVTSVILWIVFSFSLI